jgi:hypothetical protein
MLTTLVHRCKPDAKKKPPLTSLSESQWGLKPWQGLRNPAEGHRDQNNMTGVVSVNLKKTPS